MQEDQITAYLQSHPEFFEKNANLLADIHLPSPHGNGAISLVERQQLAQRDKINALEERYAELVLNAQDNDQITNKLHQFFVLLQKAKSFDVIEQLINQKLVENFNITDTCLRIWASPIDSKDAGSLAFSATPESTHTWVNDIQAVYCGESPTNINVDDWFVTPANSIAVMPLKTESVYGYLALASEEKGRFHVSTGIDFLQKLGGHISAALSRHVVE
tara:strand:+ start:922 stop:1575 length:654 start_codon:yes stop_codon:yes gene_type:complete